MKNACKYPFKKTSHNFLVIANGIRISGSKMRDNRILQNGILRKINVMRGIRQSSFPLYPSLITVAHKKKACRNDVELKISPEL